MNKLMKLYKSALALSLMMGTYASTINATQYQESELTSYSAMNMDVYMNSRVTSITQVGNGFNVQGYMFENGSMNASYNDARNWREIVFVSVNDPNTQYAYRKQVNAQYNPWLNKNATATQNGKYDLSYANYSVTVNPNDMNAFNGNVPHTKMADGEYYVYMRISNGKTSYLFPLRDATLSDGTNMENTGKLPTGFKVADQETRTLTYTVGNVATTTQETAKPEENVNDNTGVNTNTNSNTPSLEGKKGLVVNENAKIGGDMEPDGHVWNCNGCTIH